MPAPGVLPGSARPVVSCGGAGGRRDPTAVKVADLSVTEHDRLLHRVRDQLRKMHGFPRGKVRFGIDCVYSPEPLVFAQPDGSVCATRAAAIIGEDLRLNCESGLGTATFVTGIFGLVAAARVVERIAGANLEAPEARRPID
jgi:tRNA threonylcarbamoyladenosine dehydratase